MVRRRLARSKELLRKRSLCRHRDWKPVALRHVGDAYQRQDRCVGCGIERFVEVEA